MRDVLLRRGHRVQALARPRATRELPRHLGLTWIAGDLEDRAALDALVAGADAIVHLAYSPLDAMPPAGRSLAEHFAQTNLAGTVRLIERTPATRLRQLLFASSLAVFGHDPGALPGADRLPLDEDFPLWPREFYGAHKAALEKLVIAAAGDPGMNASCWRIGCVLGAYADAQRDPMATLAAEARAHGEIRSRKGAYVIGADDVAAVLADALGDDATRGQVVHVFDRWLDFASLAPRAAMRLSRPVRVTAAAAPPPPRAIANERLRARFTAFTTDAAIDAALDRLLGRAP